MELWDRPVAIQVALSINLKVSIAKGIVTCCGLAFANVFTEIILSQTMPLVKAIPIVHKVFNLLPSDEICFLYEDPSREGYSMYLVFAVEGLYAG